jgi:multisubunit Na+/H+ antiporter MnhF subunit
MQRLDAVSSLPSLSRVTDDVWIVEDQPISAAGLELPIRTVVVRLSNGDPQRLVAVQLLSSLSALLLIALSFAFGQPSSIDLAFSAALLAAPGTLLLALFLERWI